MKSFKKNFSKLDYDDNEYLIPKSVVEKTEKILKEYGIDESPHEGLVYWGGIIENSMIKITSVFAPTTDSSWGRVSTTHTANFQYVIQLNKKKIIHIAQIHSHPGNFVDHSEGDSKWAAFKADGLISIVVPDYCKFGMLPLQNCGIHRYENGTFSRLNQQYVKKHFSLIDEPLDFVEMRI